MRLSLRIALVVLVVFLTLAGSVAAQAGRNRPQSPEPKKKVQRPENLPPESRKQEEPADDVSVSGNDQQDVETVKIETNLVTVPVIASDRGDRYLSDLKQEEFTLYEDGVKHEISFFETVTAPFHVVLMLDTSASTQEKLGQIQQAAIAFTEQLQKADRVKVIAFDDRLRDLCVSQRTGPCFSGRSEILDRGGEQSSMTLWHSG